MTEDLLQGGLSDLKQETRTVYGTQHSLSRWQLERAWLTDFAIRVRVRTQHLTDQGPQGASPDEDSFPIDSALCSCGSAEPGYISDA